MAQWVAHPSLTLGTMGDTIFVNLHTHTSLSDGVLTPEVLARRLADAGVRYAALADHDTMEGWPRFRHALDARGVPSLPAIELTVLHAGRVIHVVAYGFDPDHPEFVAALASTGGYRAVDTRTIEGSLRAASGWTGSEDRYREGMAPEGRLEVGVAIDVFHRAGGRVFLALSLIHISEPTRLVHSSRMPSSA